MRTAIACLIVLSLLCCAAPSADADIVINGQVWIEPVPLPLPQHNVHTANAVANGIVASKGARLPTPAEFAAAQAVLARSRFNNGIFRVYFTSQPGTQWTIVLGRAHSDGGQYSGHDFITGIRY